MSQQKQSYACIICQSFQHQILFGPWQEITDPAALYGAASGIRGTQNIVKCSSCGFIYENPRYDEQTILQGYTNTNEKEHDSQYPMRVKSFYKSLQSLAKKGIPAKGAKVLDIGTAGGAFLEAAKQYGYDAHGLEPSKFLVEQGKQRGLNIHHGTIMQNELPEVEFDMICLWDVIEHLVDPKRDLKQILKYLKPEGILLVNFPDIGTWQAKLAGKRFWWILSVHLFHFTRKSLAQLLSKSGYQSFYFQRYWQILEFGYLVGVAKKLNVPGSGFIEKLLPNFIKKISIPYYASQTTALAKIKER